MTNFIESIKEGFSIIKEELEELDRRTDFNRLFLDKMLNNEFIGRQRGYLRVS